MVQKNMQDLVFNYQKLRGRIKEVLGTQEKYADLLGIGRVSVSQRLNNQLEFSQKEMFRTSEILHFMPNEIPVYFFTLEVQESEQK